MIKISDIIIQQEQGPRQLSKQQFIKLFNKNCKNIHSESDLIYRGRQGYQKFMV